MEKQQQSDGGEAEAARVTNHILIAVMEIRMACLNLVRMDRWTENTPIADGKMDRECT